MQVVCPFWQIALQFDRLWLRRTWVLFFIFFAQTQRCLFLWHCYRLLDTPVDFLLLLKHKAAPYETSVLTFARFVMFVLLLPRGRHICVSSAPDVKCPVVTNPPTIAARHGYSFDKVLSCSLSLPRVTNFKISPAASPEILHLTVWRAWLFMAYSDER